ncbi:helicase domain protein [Desulfofarcimen acetoxidans DSM 771]|uniref:Helicase domain protein n=1 Tax=Desulfofarcimen acetoxidans (strain ATCC 49208 / DSM 771 / KCTC 5769 / VKM B-1644 / 5575) TaxID=485916 RepID=C8VVH6_DESAS|nr:DEAD/DEAH box helicase [Desulfofarcimen acetoxidans]ACV62291.1 helicase domain protein [Desulfofarcimen acetoxidans DSM 771]
MTLQLINNYAPGARVEIRGEEWLVRRRDTTFSGGYALACTGLSELVRDVEATFLTEAEEIRALRPEETILVQDDSPQYRRSILYIESLLQKTAPTDGNLYVGQRAAMNAVPYQLDPALQALARPRQRILIADAVGLGKTLEAGVLISELILRGKGKRILVLTVKSMLTQFQKEMWSRFTIPLVRLDSAGINRVRSKIPSNQNPFYYYDKTIISIDTLKRDREYRCYLEVAYWDIIVIDEAHNVAERGTNSLRSKLAKLLASRSDTLILLSATPHDGSAESFASLMNMLDPTAIANPKSYGPEDIKQLYIRRFKKDIQSQVDNAFKVRTVHNYPCPVTQWEEAVFDLFAEMKFEMLDDRRSAGQLFKTTLEKALLSSPAACLQTIGARLRRLAKDSGPAAERDRQSLEQLQAALETVTVSHFGKYLSLVQLLKSAAFGWTGQDTTDRLVIFTERIETLRFLERQLPADLGLPQDAVAVLYGEMGDGEQQAVVESFGQENSPVRLLIASDVASEGINLHFLSHRLIHFDIPWSLMTFQQRNGRIDRYGQECTPEIYYLVTETSNPKIRGDVRILEVLIQKDLQAMQNIGDPSAIMGVYDEEKETAITAAAIEREMSADDFDQQLKPQFDDLLELFLNSAQQNVPKQPGEQVQRQRVSLYAGEFEFLQDALQYLNSLQPLQYDVDTRRREIKMTAPPDLAHRFQYLPDEIYPEHGRFVLSARSETMDVEIRRSRKDARTWPAVHYLWPLHPVLEWVSDKVNSSLRRQEAPVLLLPELPGQETIFLISGLVPNRKGHPLIHEWFGVLFDGHKYKEIISLEEVIRRTGLGKKVIPNTGQGLDLASLRSLLGQSINQAHIYLTNKLKEFTERTLPEINRQLEALALLKGSRMQQLEFDFGSDSGTMALRRKEAKQREAEKVFAEYQDWLRDTMTAENIPYIQVAAVFKGGR